MPTVTVPTADPVVVAHHERALTVIAAMSPSRAYGAETNLRGWRRTVDGIDPAREDGWAFKGTSLIAGATGTFSEGTLIVAYDGSWAKAKWYAGNFIAPTERFAGLYEVADGELIRRVQAVRSGWTQDLVGWLRANRPDIVRILQHSEPADPCAVGSAETILPTTPPSDTSHEPTKLDRGDDHATAARDLRQVVLRTRNRAAARIERGKRW